MVWFWTYVSSTQVWWLIKFVSWLSGLPCRRTVRLYIYIYINRFVSIVSYPSHVGFYTILGTLLPPSHYLYYVEFLLCYKTVSADNSFWISTLYKYSILYMKTYLNTSFVLTSYLFYLIFTTGDSNRDSVSICLQLLILLTLLFVCLFSLFSFFLLFASWILHTASV